MDARVRSNPFPGLRPFAQEEADLFFGLAQGGVLDGLAGLDGATRKGELTAVGGEAGGPQREQEHRLALPRIQKSKPGGRAHPVGNDAGNPERPGARRHRGLSGGAGERQRPARLQAGDDLFEKHLLTIADRSKLE